MGSSSFIRQEKGRKSRKLIWKSNGLHRTIGLGVCKSKTANHFKSRFDELCECKELGVPLTSSLVKWIQQLKPTIRGRLVELGLLSESLGATLGQFTRDYIDSRQSLSNSTIRKLENERTRLTSFFGKERPVHEVTEADAQAYREHLLMSGSLETSGKGLSPASVNRCCGLCSQFFKAAISKRIITVDPFDKVQKSNLSNPSKFVFIDESTFKRWMSHVPTWQFRVTLALGRFGGLRIPSEVVRLRWQDVHWANGSSEEYGYIMVENVKTKHHSTVDDYRQVPIFPELLPYLEEAYEMSKEGAEWIVEGLEGFDRNRDQPTKPNLRTTAIKTIRRAGLEPWPDLLKNLRKTRQTELTNIFPQHVVCKWLGNSEKVAETHYLHVTEDHLRAACNTNTANAGAPNRAPVGAVLERNSPSHEVEEFAKRLLTVLNDNKSFQEEKEWAMRDSNRHAFHP